MFKKIKTTLACCSALMMLCAVPLNANAAYIHFKNCVR